MKCLKPAAGASEDLDRAATLPRRCVLVTNIPAPYRNPVYERLPHGSFHVVFCARTEANRRWSLDEPRFPHTFLNENTRERSDGFNYAHNNPDVWSVLNRLRPDTVISGGSNPTHLYAFAWAQIHGARYVYMTDGTLSSESHLGWKHRLVRRIVFSRSSAFIVASRGGIDLMQSYGIGGESIFLSRLCADNDRFGAMPTGPRDFDVMFSGRLHEGKLPFLFADICAGLVKRCGQCRALVLGDGPLRRPVLERMEAEGVEVTYPGFLQPSALAPWYARSRLLLLTTRRDAWGVVANEAMASGTPVLTTPEAGAANDLVIDGVTGRVLPAERDVWVDACVELLSNASLWGRLSKAATLKVREYTYDAAADEIVKACRYAARV